MGLSQRRFASRAGVSFRALQMLEAGHTDPRLSTLEKIGEALGHPAGGLTEIISDYWSEDDDSIVAVSARIAEEGEDSWKIRLFEFVDAFRAFPRGSLIEYPPFTKVSLRMRCLMTATVETLCRRYGIEIPWWCAGSGVLPSPWFVSGVENLKAIALVESPAAFRRRNIFVLGNFLDRA